MVVIWCIIGKIVTVLIANLVGSIAYAGTLGSEGHNKVFLNRGRGDYVLGFDLKEDAKDRRHQGTRTQSKHEGYGGELVHYPENSNSSDSQFSCINYICRYCRYREPTIGCLDRERRDYVLGFD